jgi:hypothetical protein
MDILWILWCNCKFRSMDFTFFSSAMLQNKDVEKFNLQNIGTLVQTHDTYVK